MALKFRRVRQPTDLLKVSPEHESWACLQWACRTCRRAHVKVPRRCSGPWACRNGPSGDLFM